jgi:hypothetical protein
MSPLFPSLNTIFPPINLISLQLDGVEADFQLQGSALKNIPFIYSIPSSTMEKTTKKYVDWNAALDLWHTNSFDKKEISISIKGGFIVHWITMREPFPSSVGCSTTKMLINLE